MVEEEEVEEQEDLRRRQPQRSCQEDELLPHESAVPNLHTTQSEWPTGEFRFCSHIPASATNTCLKPHFNAPAPAVR